MPAQQQGFGLQHLQAQFQANTKSVNVKREDLLGKLKANRQKHLADHKTAMEGFYIEVRKVAAKLHEDAQAGKFDNVGLFANESVPINHVDAYDQVIAMMEMSVDDIINMEAQDVQQYVLDNWSWKPQFVGSTAKYMNNR